MKLNIASSTIAICIALVAGCVSSSLRPGQNVYVYVTGAGNITLDGKPVEMPDLPKRLKKMGATQDTPIIFKTQGDVPPRMLHSLVNAMQSNGFTKAMFQGQRHADAFVPGAEVEHFENHNSIEGVQNAPPPSPFPSASGDHSMQVRPSPRNAGAKREGGIRESPRNVGSKNRQ